MIGGEWGSNVVSEGATSAVGDAEQRGKTGAAAATGFGAGVIGGLATGKLAGNGGSGKGKDSKDNFTEKSQKEVGDQLAGMADSAKRTPDAPAAVTTAQAGQTAQSAQTGQATPDAATATDAQASTTETADKQASIASLGDTANTTAQAKASTPAPTQASSLADAQTNAPAPAPTQTLAVSPLTPEAQKAVKAKAEENATSKPVPLDTDLAKPKADKPTQEQSPDTAKVRDALQAGLAAAAETARAAAKGLGAPVQDAPAHKPRNIDLAVRADDDEDKSI